ncbi:MAG: hypothetical protein RLZZ182_1580 [Pseudomonadota bacterium]|jgi:hypothetical protein
MRVLTPNETQQVSGSALSIGQIFPAGSLGALGHFFDVVAIGLYMLISGKTFADLY